MTVGVTDAQLLELLDGYVSKLEAALHVPSLRLASAELTASLAHQLQARPVARSPFVLCKDPLAAFYRMSLEAEVDGAPADGGGGSSQHHRSAVAQGHHAALIHVRVRSGAAFQ